MPNEFYGFEPDEVARTLKHIVQRPDTAPPEIRKLKNAVALPGMTGLYDIQGHRIDHAAARTLSPHSATHLRNISEHLCSERTNKLHKGTPNVAKMPTDLQVIDYPVLYGGCLFNHYGHFIVDSMSRLWARDLFPSLPIVFMRSSPWRSTTYSSDILNALNLSSRIIFVDKPTVFDEIICPGTSFEYRYKVFSIADEPHTTVTKVFQGTSRCVWRRPVYLTRAGLGLRMRKCSSEVELESELKRRGFEIARPEELHLSEQISLFQQSPLVLGTIGSAFHTALFSCRSDAALAILNWGRGFEYYLLIDALKQHQSYYLKSAHLDYQEDNLVLDVEESLQLLQKAGLIVDQPYLGRGSLGPHADGRGLPGQTSSTVRHPTDRELASLVQSHLNSKELDAALASAQLLVENHRNDPESWRVFAEVQLARQLPENALEALREGLRTDPDSYVLLRTARHVARVLHLRRESLAFALRMLKLAPDVQENRLMVAQLYYELGDFEAALGHSRELLRWRYPNAAVMVARCLEAENQVDDALATLEDALAESPGDARLMKVACAIACRHGRFDKALSFGLPVTELAVPSHLEGRDSDAALASAQLLLDNHRNDPESWRVFAEVQLARQLPEKAWEALREGLRTDPDSYVLLRTARHVARVLHLRRESLEFALRMLKLAPDVQENRLRVAQSYYELGDFKAALNYYRELLRSKYPNAAVMVARCLEAENQVDDALATLESALAEVPGDARLMKVARAIACRHRRFDKALTFGLRRTELARLTKST